MADMKMARRIVQLHRRLARLSAQAARQRDALDTTDAQLRLTREMIAELSAMLGEAASAS